jgi:copper transport protein
VAGLSLAWIHVGAVRALTSTTYGWTLVVKSAAVAVVLGSAAYNHRVLVPSIVSDSGEGAWERLRKTVRFELVGLAVVVAVTALLVNLQPAGEAAGVSGPFSTYVPFGEFQLNVVVDPNRAGTNELHLYVLTPGGLPALVTGEADIEFRMPADDIGPISRSLQLAGPGHYLHVGSELAIPGEWVITVRQRLSQFDEDSVDVTVTVNR